jgi:tetratricopeptide (TPR) repeat protein
MAAELARVAYRTFLVEDFEAAIESAREALELDPSNAVANAVLGNALVATGLNSADDARIDEARRHVATALELDSELAIAHNARALEQVADKQMDEARRSLRRAIESDPALGPAHANLAYLLAQAGDLKEAEREYRLAIALDSESAVPYNGLSDVLFQRKKFKDAVQASLEAISRYELRDRVLGLFYVQLAVTQFQRGKHNESAEAVARAKALGVTDHPAFEALARGKSKKG